MIIHYMMTSLGKKTKLHQCIRYSFIGFFYSCITPSASGGQPAQIYYMSKDGLDVSVSTLVLMIVTITYKAVLVLVGFVVLLFMGPVTLAYMGSSTLPALSGNGTQCDRRDQYDDSWSSCLDGPSGSCIMGFAFWKNFIF